MLSRENIYRRLAVLHDEIDELEEEKKNTSSDEMIRTLFGFTNKRSNLERMINFRKNEIKQLESDLRKDLNPKTLHLMVVYEKELDFDDIVKNGIRGISL